MKQFFPCYELTLIEIWVPCMKAAVLWLGLEGEIGKNNHYNYSLFQTHQLTHIHSTFSPFLSCSDIIMKNWYLNIERFTGLPTNDKTVKTTSNSVDIRIPRLEKVFKWLIKWFGKERHKFTIAGNHEYKEIDSTNSVQSSLKSHLIWETPVCIYKKLIF